MEWISKLIEILKIPLRYFWVFFLISCFFLFIPESWLNYLKIVEFKSHYQLYISLIFIISLSILLVETTLIIYKKSKLSSINKRHKRKLINRLSKLDPQEKSVIREFFIQNQNTLKLPYDEPIISGMLKNGLLKIVGRLGENSLAGVLVPIEINPLIEEEILPIHIDFPTSDPITKNDEDFLMNNRPDFMPEIYHHKSVFHRGWWRS